MSKEIKIGLIGAGWMGKAHTTAFHNARMINFFIPIANPSISGSFYFSRILTVSLGFYRFLKFLLFP